MLFERFGWGAADWSDSLRVKIFRPLRENAIKLMLRKNRR